MHFLAVLIVANLWSTHAAIDSGDPAALIGIWRGTSTCTDRVAAPACQDEKVVYEFTSASRAGTVHWIADKIVDGKRESMGDLDLTYDAVEKCWKAEFSSLRTRVVWRLSIEGTLLTGTARLTPGNQTVRKVELRRESSGKAPGK